MIVAVLHPGRAWFVCASGAQVESRMTELNPRPAPCESASMQVAFRLLLDCRRRTDLAERRDGVDMDRMGRDVAAEGTVDPVRVPRVPGRAVERDRR